MYKKETKSPKNGLGYLLFALFIITVFYAVKKGNDYNKLENVFYKEKKHLKSDINRVIKSYKKLSLKNKELSKKLKKEVKKAIELKKSLKKVKAGNSYLLLEYRRKFVILEKRNRKLLKEVDSLKHINNFLVQENLIASQRLMEKDFETEDLLESNKELLAYKNSTAHKLVLGSIIKVDLKEFISLKKKRSGKYKETSRCKKVDAFKISFRLLENQLASNGKKDIYIQILDSDGNVVSPKEKIKLLNHKIINYSDKIIVNYQNKTIDLLSLIEVSNKLKSGKFIANIFISGRLVGFTSVILR